MGELGDKWIDWAAWRVSQHYRLPPHVVADEWTAEQLYEAYYYLRLGDLTNPEGLV